MSEFVPYGARSSSLVKWEPNRQIVFKLSSRLQGPLTFEPLSLMQRFCAQKMDLTVCVKIL